MLEKVNFEIKKKKNKKKKNFHFIFFKFNSQILNESCQ